MLNLSLFNKNYLHMVLGALLSSITQLLQRRQQVYTTQRRQQESGKTKAILTLQSADQQSHCDEDGAFTYLILWKHTMHG